MQIIGPRFCDLIYVSQCLMDFETWKSINKTVKSKRGIGNCMEP